MFFLFVIHIFVAVLVRSYGSSALMPKSCEVSDLRGCNNVFENVLKTAKENEDVVAIFCQSYQVMGFLCRLLYVYMM